MPRQNQGIKVKAQSTEQRGGWGFRGQSMLEHPDAGDERRRNRGGVNRFIRSMSQSPVLIAVASGVGAYLAGRLLMSYYKDHPEIGEFVRENVESIESRLRDFRGSRGSHSEDLSQA